MNLEQYRAAKRLRRQHLELIISCAKDPVQAIAAQDMTQVRETSYASSLQFTLAEKNQRSGSSESAMRSFVLLLLLIILPRGEHAWGPNGE